MTMYEFIHLGLKYEELDEFQKAKADWLEEKDYAEKTKSSYWKLINGKIHRFEKINEKDLYDFSKQEIIQLFKNNYKEKKSTLQQLKTIIKKYIDWAYKKGLKTGKNPCEDIDNKEIFECDKLDFEENYIKLEDFYNFILDLNCSDVDRAMLTLLRYGVDAKDVGKVKWDDVNAKGKNLRIIHEDKKNSYELELPIDDEFINIINKAKMCKYRTRKVNKNNNMKKELTMISYVDKGYIVKPSANVKWDCMSNNNVYNKVAVISEENNIKRISVHDLNLARRYDLLFDMVEKYDITMNDVQRILEIFDKKAKYGKTMRLRDNFEILSGKVVDRLPSGVKPGTKIEPKNTNKDEQKLKNNFIDKEDSDYQDNINKGFEDNYNNILNHQYVEKEKKQQSENKTKKVTYIREPRVGQLALQLANFQCEFNNKHETFISNTTSKNYVEAHHLIPIRYYYSDEFNVSIDNEANIVALCPSCHRCLHYGKFEDKKKILKNLYDANKENLEKVGIRITFNRLLEMYMEC